MKFNVLLTGFCIFTLLLSACNGCIVPEQNNSTLSSTPVTTSSVGSQISMSDAGNTAPVFKLAVTTNGCSSSDVLQGDTDDQQPPGALADPTFFPRPEQTDIGKTVKLSAEIMTNIQPDSTERTFVYVYIPATQQGRLLLFANPSFADAYTTVTIFAPRFAGGEELCEALKGDFQAQITDILNVSYQEGYYIRNVSFYSQERHQRMNGGEVVDIHAFISSGNTDVEYYFGWLTTNAEKNLPLQEMNSGIYAYITANLAENQSEEMKTAISVFSRIVERFDLQDTLGLN